MSNAILSAKVQALEAQVALLAAQFTALAVAKGAKPTTAKKATEKPPGYYGVAVMSASQIPDAIPKMAKGVMAWDDLVALAKGCGVRSTVGKGYGREEIAVAIVAVRTALLAQVTPAPEEEEEEEEEGEEEEEAPTPVPAPKAPVAAPKKKGN